MTVEALIYSALSSIASGKCYPMVAPDNATAPFVIYQVATNTPLVTLDGSNGVYRRRIQIDAYAATYSSAKTLESAITAAMAAATTFSSIPLSLEDIYEEPTKLFRSMLEFAVWNIS